MLFFYFIKSIWTEGAVGEPALVVRQHIGVVFPNVRLCLQSEHFFHLSLHFGFTNIRCKDATRRVTSLPFTPMIFFYFENVSCKCSLVPDLLENCLVNKSGFSRKKMFPSFPLTRFSQFDPECQTINGLKETRRLHQYPEP